eukprot:709743-Amorphochlora_amoeboformis.AAC.1
MESVLIFKCVPRTSFRKCRAPSLVALSPARCIGARRSRCVVVRVYVGTSGWEMRAAAGVIR